MAGKIREADFDAIRSNLMDFLKSQKALSDYDLDQTASEILISLLANNTHANAVTGNMLFSEMFLDTAQLRKNIASGAKRYGYTPSSELAAKAVVDLTLTTNDQTPPQTVTLEKGSIFTSSSAGEAPITFSTIKSVAASLVNSNQYKFTNVELYQGAYGAIDFFIDKTKSSQTYEIKVKEHDTTLLEVYVQASEDYSSFKEFTRADSALSIDATSEVYFLQEGPNGFYQIEFGDDVIGKGVDDGAVVRVVYFKTNHVEANGIKTFNFSYTPTKSSPVNLMTSDVVMVQKALGGTERESDTSVKLNAPKFYVSQNRGVVANDYEHIVKQRFPYIKSISVWSGKTGEGDLDQFGRVYISVNTSKAHFITENQKEEILNTVRDEIAVAGIIPVIVDVDNVYLDLSVEVFVSDFVYIKASDIEEKIQKYVSEYSSSRLERFAGEFEHSRFVDGVDALDASIKNNLTTVTLHKRVFPDTSRQTAYKFSFVNRVKNCITNSFTFDNKTVFMEADSSGVLNLYEIVGGNKVLIKSNIGLVDFATGDVTVSSIHITKSNDTTKDVRFFAEPATPNVASKNNTIAAISNAHVTITRKT